MRLLNNSGSAKQAGDLTVADQNADMKGRALRAALYALGIGGVIGGGARMAKELVDPLLNEEPKLQDREIAIDITNPSNRRRVKQSGEEPMTSPMQWPWAIPLVTGGAALGLYGGNKLVRSIVEGIKKRRAQTSLDEAQQEFEDALRTQYQTKYSALEQAMEASFARYEKQAADEAGTWDYAKGLGLTGMAALWLLTHKSFLDAAKKTDPEALQMKILERQRRLRQTMSPPPIVFDMAPGDSLEKTSADEDEDGEEDEEENESAAVDRLEFLAGM
jgi:hypothetical protein